MSATDVALTVPGIQVTDFINPDGTPRGFIFREGTQVVSRDANLANRTPLFTLANNFFWYEGQSFTPGPPGLWFFVDGTTLYGVNLATPSVRVVLANLVNGELPKGEPASDGSTVYLAINNQTANTGRLIAFDGSLQATPVANFTEQVQNFSLTSTRIAVALGSSVVTLPKTGGSQVPVITWGQSEFASFVVTSGNNVYLPITAIAGNGTTSRIEIAAHDGSNRETWANSAFAGWGWGATTPIWFDFGRFDVLYVVSPTTSATDQSGATLRSVDGATRATRLTYGTLQATPPGVLFADQFDNFLYGDAHLFSYVSTGSTSAREVYFVDTDVGNSLVRVTNLVTTATAASPVTALGPSKPAGVGWRRPR
jgi:hypothetical protein